MTIDELVAFLDQTKPLISMDKITQFEREIGGSLPSGYRNFLIACNGGHANPTLWFKGKNPHGIDVEAGFSCAFGFREENFFDLVDAWDDVGWKKDFVVPINDDSFGNFTCIGFRGDELGKVLFKNHETHEWKLIANSFEDYVAGLRVINL